MAQSYSARSRAIEPFHVMALLARANELQAAGHDVIHLEIGEPDFTTAAPIVAAGQAALAAGHTRYTAARGLPALREAMVHHLAVPVQAVALEGAQDRIAGAGHLARRVGVFHAQQPAAIDGAGVQPRGQGGHQRAEVQETTGGRGEAPDVGGGSHGLRHLHNEKRGA